MDSGAQVKSEPRPGLPDESLELEAVGTALQALERRSTRFSLARLLLFLGIIAGLILGAKSGDSAALLSVPTLAGFILVIVLHSRLHDRKERLETRQLLLTERKERRTSRKRIREAPSLPAEGDRLESGQGLVSPKGAFFKIDEGLAQDLDLASGPRPLFGFLDRTSTVLGARRLLFMLTRLLLSGKDIATRQEAVAELAAHHELREGILDALAPLRKHPLETVPSFLRSEPQFRSLLPSGLVAHFFGTMSLVPLFGVLFLDALAWMPPLFGMFFLNLGIIGVTVRKTNSARDKILLFGPLLDGIHRLDQWLITGNPRSESLVTAARAIQEERPTNRKLRRAVRLLELHTQGMAFELFNVLTLWELRFVPRTERLLLGKKTEITGALLALTDLEALVSLSCPMAEQGDFILPTVTEASRPHISGDGVGHPLIQEWRVVRNPVEIGGETVTLVVTGSNMAGKSTYLKAVAVNVLLAQAGGPVSARSFLWTPVEMYSDLNVRDSLDDGKSYFQVEVERVADVLRASERTPFVLAILDELFRGTNSDERLALSRAILRHLRDTGALAIVATHDNALTHLAERDAEPGMRNVHFEETVTDAAMTFDYSLREGPARTRNAIRVLEITGYPEEIIRRARSEAGEDVR